MDNEMVTQERLVSGIPFLVCFKQDTTSPKPLIILSHGFSRSKDDMKDKLKVLVSMGYYAVAIDNRGHGERADHDFMSQVFQDDKLDVHLVRRLIKETADDIHTLIDHFATNKQVDAQRIGMLGVSMGGFVTFRALVIEKRIKVAAPIIASPYWDDLPAGVPVLDTPEAKQALTAYARQYSPAHHPQAFFPRPVLMQIGGQDDHYDGERVKQFYRELKHHYREADEHVQLIVHDDIGHEFTELMWENAINWFGATL